MERPNFTEEDKTEKKEKPSVMYHASHNHNITEFVPRQERVRDPEEGPVIFATPDKALASAFLIEGHNDDWTNIGFYNDIPVAIICSSREEFIEKDKGGILYSLPSDTFDFDAHRGMGEREWSSHVSVKPVDKIECLSTLDTMIENGVQIYFVDKQTFENINHADDHGFQILLGLKSENAHRGINVKSLG